MSNAVYIQSGGPTAVINYSAVAVIQECRKHPEIKRLYAARHGILGLLNNDLVDTTDLKDEDLDKLGSQPGACFGSSRKKLTNKDMIKVFKVLKKYNIHYMFYNGGNGTAFMIERFVDFAAVFKHDLKCVGIAKTIDNDLACTDVSPGFGSAARYVANAVLNASFDIASMCMSSTNVLILEVMGREVGWLCAAGDIHDKFRESRMCLFPEKEFVEQEFIQAVVERVQNTGFCCIVVAEGLVNNGGFASVTGQPRPGFILSNLITKHLDYRVHVSIPDYLQRSCIQDLSVRDIDCATLVGKAAVQYALTGDNGVMAMIEQAGTTFSTKAVPASDVASQTKGFPTKWIDCYGITEEARNLLRYWACL